MSNYTSRVDESGLSTCCVRRLSRTPEKKNEPPALSASGSNIVYRAEDSLLYDDTADLRLVRAGGERQHDLAAGVRGGREALLDGLELGARQCIRVDVR